MPGRLGLQPTEALTAGSGASRRPAIRLGPRENLGQFLLLVAVGAMKAATNFLAGTLSDRHGRKPVLVTGWLIGLPVPLMLMWAPSWGWIIAANVLLGMNQGLTWSTTVIMKIDLVVMVRMYEAHPRHDRALLPADADLES